MQGAPVCCVNVCPVLLQPLCTLVVAKALVFLAVGMVGGQGATLLGVQVLPVMTSCTLGPA